MSAYWKIPLQALVLLRRRADVRVLRVHAAADAVQPGRTSGELREGPRAAEYPALEQRLRGGRPRARPPAAAAVARADRRRRRGARRAGGDAQFKATRGGGARGPRRGAGAGARGDRRRAPTTTSTTSSRRSSLTHMPIGLVGLLIVGDLRRRRCRPIAGELTSLSTATVIDFYRRFVRPDASDAHYLRVSRVATGVLGPLRQRRRGLGGGARLADRGRQPLRVVLLRLDPRRVHPGDRLPARHGDRRLRRPDRRHERRWPGCDVHRRSPSSGTT